jgi:hypothetical protein
MRGNTERIDKIIESVLSKKGITRNIQSNKIRNILTDLLGKSEAEHIQIENFKNNRLILSVDSSSLLYELKCFKKDQLLEALKKEQSITINEITFVLGMK